MKVSARWLGEFFSPDDGDSVGNSDALAATLTARGLEVESVARGVGGDNNDDKKIVAGLIAKIAPHPNAERLKICEVNIGDNAPLQIVCGAANAKAGQLVAVAREGARLGLMKTAIRRADIRGVTSAGMICSASELGLAEGKSPGILVIHAKRGEKPPAPGASLISYLELDDAALDIAITPNRGDCLSHLGVAREIAAARSLDENRDIKIQTPQTRHKPALDEEYPIAIDKRAAEGCPRFCALIVRGITNAADASPPWLAARLTRCGLRPVGMAVDITNYVMLELGQPLHAFDLAKIRGGITVRHAKAGERVRLLGGRETAADSDTLVVADEAGAQALGGIMGGADSGVSEATTDILLEAAFWNPAAIRGRARRYRLNSEAAFRFERGVDFTLPPKALGRAGSLFADVCGAKTGEVFQARAMADPTRPLISLPAGKIKSVLGVAVAADEAANILSRLGFSVKVKKSGEINAGAPPWRFDAALAADLIEEVARLRGYDKLPATLPKAMCDFLPLSPNPAADARRLLAARGYSEVVNFAFVSEDWERDFYGANNPVRLENPIAEQMAVMRSGLLGGLADRALFNFHHRQTRVKFFELGRCFFTAAAGGKEEAEEKIMQPQKIAAFAIGENNPPHWDSPPRAVDFYDVKGDVEALLAGLRPRFAALDKPHPALHPGKAAAVIVGGKPCGFIGELHPRLAAPFRARPAVFELDFDRVAGHIISAPPPQVRSFSKFPQVRRDLAVVVDEAVSAGELLDIAQTFAATDERIAGVALFDRYAGDNIAAGKKSLGLRVLMQGALANIEEREIAALMAGLEKALAAGCGAVRRG